MVQQGRLPEIHRGQVLHEALLAGEAIVNDDARPQQQRRRSRRRQDNAPRRQNQRGGFSQRRRNDYASGQYSSIYTGPFPTDADEDGGLNLADLQAKSVDELRELAAEHDIEGHEEMEHSDLVLKLLDVVPLAPSKPERNGHAGLACAPVIGSPDRRASRRTRRSTGACCGSTRSTASSRRSPSDAPTSTTSCRSSRTRCSTSRPTRRTSPSASST